VIRIRWTTDAFNQLESIVKYIRAGNPDAAPKTAQAIIASIGKLENFPDLGRPSQDVERTRELCVPP